MKIVIAICVYNRYDNIKTWLNCWSQCQQHNAELVIIHNYYGNEVEKEKFKSLCDKSNIKYVPRNSIGFDIGAFQDICRERLEGFSNDWDLLLWCADDTLPMQKDFLKPYLDKLTDKVGIVCMDLSPYVRTHIRTSGFMIRKETAGRLQFEKDPITTKEDCYRFEHRDPKNWFYQQIIRMGLTVVQVEKRETSPLWDAGYHRGLKRLNEHLAVFSPNISSDKVIFICPVFNMYPQIISSLLCQTHQNWELLLIHNGPLNGMKYDIPEDSRIKFIVYPEATGKWGHPLRQWALKQEVLLAGADYVVITNADNYHVPAFTKSLLSGFTKSNTVASYCANMVHSYIGWGVIPCRLQRGYVDCAGVMVRKEIAADTGWRDVDSHSSDWTYFQDIITKYGADKWVKIPGCLLVHN